jgi:DNA polymerase III subunit epsilon
MEGKVPTEPRAVFRPSMPNSSESIERDTLLLVALDFESIPLADGPGDAPVQIGLIGGTPTSIDPASAWSSYLNPGKPLSPRKGQRLAPEIATAPSLLSLWPQVRDSLRGSWLVAHGIGTEKRFLRTFPGHGLGPWIDTLRWSRAAYPDLASHALGDLCQTLGLEPHLRSLNLGHDWHEALFDATAALLLLQHLLALLPPGPISTELLHAPRLEAYFAHRQTRTNS